MTTMSAQWFPISAMIAAGFALAAPAWSQDLYAHKVGKIHPDFSAFDQDSQAFQLTAQRGKVVVLHICALFCVPCRESAAVEGNLMTTINALVGENHWLLVDALVQNNTGGPTTATHANQWRSVFGTPARTLHANGDGNSELAALGDKVLGFPTYVVIRADGTISSLISGFTAGTTPQLLADAVETAWQEGQTSTPVVLTSLSLSPGAPRLVGENISADTALDPSGGTVATSASYTLKPGFAGQLYDVVSLVASAQSPTVNEGASMQLAAVLTMDDESTFSPLSGEIAWALVSGPVTAISPGGLATSGLVAADGSAAVRAIASGLTADTSFTVLDTIPDNFGSYAADGLGDDWQVQYFGPDNPLAAPLLDPDGDGQSNAFEFTAGLIPTNPLSRFLVSIAPVPGQPGQKQVIFGPLVSGRGYEVKSSLDLSPVSWTALVGGSVSDNGSQRTVIDTSASEPKKFYKVEIVKP